MRTDVRVAAITLIFTIVACQPAESPSEAACPEGSVSCADACADVRFDNAHCGACGRACDRGVGCFAGACTGPAEMKIGRVGHAAVVGPDGRAYVVGGGDTKKSRAEVEIYDFQANRWSDGPPLPDARSFFGATVRGGKLLVIGGSEWPLGSPGPSVVHDDVFELDFGYETWSTRPKLPAPRSDSAVTADQTGRIWVIWGFSDTDQTPLTTVLSSGADGSWQTEAVAAPSTKRPAARSNPSTRRWGARAVTAADGRVFLIGGITPVWPKSVAAVDIFDPVTRELVEGKSLPGPRALGAAVLAADGRIFYFGGHDDSATTPELERGLDVYAFDPKLDEWSVVTRMPSWLVDSSAVTGPDGRIYIFGGNGPGQLVRASYVYDPAKNEWYL